MEPLFRLQYRADVGSGLIEHEHDHVFAARWSADPFPDPAEVEDWRWVTPRSLIRELALLPDSFTPWFRLLAERLLEEVLVGSPHPG